MYHVFRSQDSQQRHGHYEGTLRDLSVREIAMQA
jgi:hypothetical protein